MMASEATVPNRAASRLWMTGNCSGSTNEVVERKNATKPTMAVTTPMVAISNTSLTGPRYIRGDRCLLRPRGPWGGPTSGLQIRLQIFLTKCEPRRSSSKPFRTLAFHKTVTNELSAENGENGRPFNISANSETSVPVSMVLAGQANRPKTNSRPLCKRSAAVGCYVVRFVTRARGSERLARTASFGDRYAK
jgi:hypothetical protein